jgi:PglZ domain
MHPLHEYLCGQLDAQLKKNVVVFYDPRREFESFFDRELKEVGKGYGDLPRVFIGERLVFLARHTDSFFALRAAIEPIATLDKPDPLIVYMPGINRDRAGSVLMEMELAGNCYEPQLRRLARHVLQKRFSDGQIDDMLRPTGVTYDDIVMYLRRDVEGTPASVLRSIFDDAHSEALLTRWLASEAQDEAIQQRDAIPELIKLIASRLGLTLPPEITVQEARQKTMRYLLVSEFRSDLGCAPPESVGMVPLPPKEDHIKRIRDVAESLRRGYAGSYIDLAHRVESEMGLAAAKIDAAHLGSIDTFAFEEKALLAHAGDLIVRGQHGDALKVVNQRHRSFWVDRDVNRQAQWEACRLMAELGQKIASTKNELTKATSEPSRWITAYAAEGGWYLVDALQRQLETWLARMGTEPETEQALGLVRREHDELLKKMAQGFSESLAAQHYGVTGILHQTHVYSDVVSPMSGPTGPVAYFLIDAMRFEMGVELAAQLDGAVDVNVRPAVAALPSITPVGMAALLPGASSSFSVGEQKGKLAASIEGTAMSSWQDRWRFLKAKVPDAVEFTLDKVLRDRGAELATKIQGASLVVIRSEEIDALGENVQGITARAAMETVIGNIARAISKLGALGVENFVVSADHGHQFAIRKDDDMKTDNPNGRTVELHRRCWIGQGGAAPPGTVRVSAAELGYQGDLEFVFPTGLGVFKAGGGLDFHHGSFSLQELVIPVLSFRLPQRRKSKVPPEKLFHLSDVPAKITNRTFGVKLAVIGSLFASQGATLRVALFSQGKQVGECGMAIGADVDRTKNTVTIAGRTEASLGMMLTDDRCTSVRIVVLDPATDAILEQSGDVPVALGI